MSTKQKIVCGLSIAIVVGALACFGIYEYNRLKYKIVPPVHQVCNSIYHWKTTYDPTDYEKQWLIDNDVHRIYIRMFDVDVSPFGYQYHRDILPYATTTFQQEVIQHDMEYVPTIYITLDALHVMQENQNVVETANKILKRALNMADYYSFPPVKEVQIDCDWTESTEETFFELCECMRDSLHKMNILLSSTIRLHQVLTEAPPVDCGVLMMYNIGDVKNYHTSNSILDPRMVKQYLNDYDYPLPLDIALPTFTWGACFRDGKFGFLLRTTDYSDTTIYEPIGNNYYCLKNSHYLENHYLYSGDEIRLETSSIKNILKAKELLPMQLKQSGIVIYHLDSANLSKYSHDEITQIYSFDH